jgi:hypothetical protein
MRSIEILALAALLSPGPAPEPYRFGLAEQLPGKDVAAVAALVATQGMPWAMYGWRSQVLPEVWYIDAFMPPTVATDRFRRGVVRHFECAPQSAYGACGNWNEVRSPGEYVQVAHGPAPFTESLTPRTPLERPTRVVGAFSERDLVTLVSYIRTSPVPTYSGGRVGMRLSGSSPISDIHLESDGSVRAWLGLDDGTGNCATFRRTRHGWRITELVMGVA